MIKNFESLSNQLMKMEANVKTLNDGKIKNDVVIRRVRLDSNQTTLQFVEDVLKEVGIQVIDQVKSKSRQLSVFINFFHHRDKLKLMKNTKKS